MRVPRCLTAMAVLTSLALVAGCGGGNTGAGTAQPTASAPDATAPPPDATQPGTTAVTPTTTAPSQTQPESGSGGAGGGTAGGGGEQSVRVPASFVAKPGGRLAPPTITVPPFLAVELSVQSSDGKAHRLTVQSPTRHTLRVPAGERAAVRIPGLRAGRYPVLLDGRRAGTLVAGGEVGP